MDKQKLLNKIVELLETVNAEDLETLSIDHTKYEDGTEGVSVELTYSAKTIKEGRLK